jgi:MoaA/NifB/PqqE/SkfB family radical SAM enzyme
VRRFWAPYADTVIPQYLLDIGGGDLDVFRHRSGELAAFPRCNMPSRAMGILWNGNVPLCGKSYLQTGLPEGLVVGNIHNASLKELWSHPIYVQYRDGHRRRDPTKMPICKGCSAG